MNASSSKVVVLSEERAKRGSKSSEYNSRMLDLMKKYCAIQDIENPKDRAVQFVMWNNEVKEARMSDVPTGF